MDDPLDGRSGDLIALLDLRARYVEQEVNARFRPRVAGKYLPRFLALHAEFTGALRRGDLMAADAMEPRFYELASQASKADRPWLWDRALALVWKVATTTGFLGGVADRMFRHQAYAPHFDPPYFIADEYLHPERIGTDYRRWDLTPDPPPTPANRRIYYLQMLEDGERAGYKSAQALLRQ